ncbi:hypothetical protein [Blochmannia endosymbiont of Camponotus sp. C-003]
MLHPSKGLEFSQVFIIGLIFQIIISLTNKDLLKENHRFIYI